MRQIKIGKVCLTDGGTWNSTTGYSDLVYVRHNGDGWWSKKANINSEPSSSNPNWIQATNVQEFIASLQTATTNANQINNICQAAEEIRKTSETARIANENERKENETTRKQNESNRVATENIRVSAESTRQSNETARINAESSRNSRYETAEASRNTTFNASEASRTSTFNANEATRQSNETTRQSNEATRQSTFEVAMASVETATGLANTAASEADTQADYAKEQGDYAKEEGDKASVLNTTVAEHTTKLSELDSRTSEISAKVDILEEVHQNPWSISINSDSSNPVLGAMGGDATSWQIYRAKIGRYIVSNDGKAKKLCKTDSRYMSDGVTEVDETQGNIMVRLPRLYYKVDEADGLLTLTMSEREFAECEIVEEQWVGAYPGSIVSNSLCSRSNKNVANNRTINQFWSAAQVNGTNWGLASYEQRKMMIMIYLCEYLNLNSQQALGNGMTGVGNNWCSVVQNAKTGVTAELGDECGKVNFTADGQLVSGACHVSLFGIEDAYGWYWEIVQGCYFGSANNEEQQGTEAYIYTTNSMPTDDELNTHPNHAYRQLVRPTTPNWLKSIIGGSKFDVLPKTLGAGSTTYWCDYHHANTTGQLLLWGGLAYCGLCCGLACSNSTSAWSNSNTTIGSRLAYHGQVEIVG